MGTIPAPNIVEDAGRISQNPLTEYARATQLGQEQQQFQQERQQREQQIEMQRRQLADQDAVTKAMGEYNTDKHTPDDIPGLILKNGGSGGASMAAQQHILGLKKTAADVAKDDSETGAKNIDTYLKRHDAAAGELQTHIASDDDASLGKNLFSSISSLGQQGFLRPDEVQHGLQLAQLAENDPKTARAQLPAYLNSFKTEKQIFEEAQKTQQQNIDQQKANAGDWKDFSALGVSVNTRTGEQRSISGGAVQSPEMMASKYVELDSRQRRGLPIAPEDKAFMQSYKDLKTLVPVANFNLQANGVQGNQKPTTDASGQPLSYDQQIKSFGAKGGVVKAIIEGRQDPPASFAQKSPYWQDIMQKVYAIDPQFNQQRAQLRKDYTVGKHSTEINAINTAMGHVGVLGDAIDALDNGNVKLLNSLANKLGVQVGKDNVTTFNTIVHRVGPELSKAYIGAGGSAGERGSDEKDFDPSLGPQQLKSNVGITAQLLRSKIASLENQWDQNKAPSMRSFGEQFIMPEAKAQLDKWSPARGGGGSQSGAFNWSNFSEHK